MSKPLRVAVFGAGHMGRHHARIYSELPDVELVGIVDTDPTRAADLASKCGTHPVAAPRELIGKIDAASIAVPTVYHAEVSKPLLEAGIARREVPCFTAARGEALAYVVKTAESEGAQIYPVVDRDLAALRELRPRAAADGDAPLPESEIANLALALKLIRHFHPESDPAGILACMSSRLTAMVQPNRRLMLMPWQSALSN